MKAENYKPKENDLVLEDGTIIIDGKINKKKKKPVERVTVMVPRIPGAKVQEDVALTINGKTILIQRGVPVSIPKNYAELLDNAMEMEKERDEFYFGMASSAEK